MRGLLMCALGATALVALCSLAAAQGSGQVAGQQCWIDGKLVGGFPPGPCPDSGSSSSSNNNTISHYEAREYSRYVSAYNHAIDLKNRGLRSAPAKALGIYESALSYLEEALRHNPGDGDALRQKRKVSASMKTCQGQLLVQSGEYDRAISLFREAEEIDPESSNIWQQNIDWARSQQQKAEKQAGVDALWSNGSQMHSRRDWKGAEAVWRQILAADPNNSAAFYNLGNELEAQDRIDEALEAFRRAHALDPNDKDTNSRIASAESARAKQVLKQQDSKVASSISASVDTLIGEVNKTPGAGQTRSITLPVNGKPEEFTVLEHPVSGATGAGSQLLGVAQQGSVAAGSTRNDGADAKDRLELGFDSATDSAGSLSPLHLTSKSPRPPEIPEKYMRDPKIQEYLVRKESAEQKYRDLGAELKTIAEKIDKKEGKREELDAAADKILDQMTAAKKEVKAAMAKAQERVHDLSVDMTEVPDTKKEPAQNTASQKKK